MRQRLQAFLPIVLVALMVQILAPIGAAWAARADPLRGIEICHGQAGSPADDESRAKQVRGDCALCCAAQPTALDAPARVAIGLSQRAVSDIVWRAPAPDVHVGRAFSHARARAPPPL
ncbi:DUF2946 family protein [Bradyrhizobium sp. HKCCYLS2038]|uniref:DUF2946 family protein n=2 Tax=unclassified Bradyrhizobium TaxID=2631580 RepID=UPI003EC126E6